MNEEQKKELFKKTGFKCEKCGYYSPLGESLEVFNESVFCSVCSLFIPENLADFTLYLNEKIDWHLLESFRKYKIQKNKLKQGMIQIAKTGKIVSRPAFGYKMEDGNLIPAENFDEVREIFQEFLNNSSLNQISKNHKMSVNGIKKILKNFTYIGKVKFDNQILQGKHSAIIPTDLFNAVQQKFDKKSQGL